MTFFKYRIVKPIDNTNCWIERRFIMLPFWKRLTYSGKNVMVFKSIADARAYADLKINPNCNKEYFKVN